MNIHQHKLKSSIKGQKMIEDFLISFKILYMTTSC